jgi:hypothetical protein
MPKDTKDFSQGSASTGKKGAFLPTRRPFLLGFFELQLI